MLARTTSSSSHRHVESRGAAVGKKLSGTIGVTNTIAQMLRRTLRLSGFFEPDQPHRHGRCYKPLSGLSEGKRHGKTGNQAEGGSTIGEIQVVSARRQQRHPRPAQVLLSRHVA